ncbi:outer membrane beta-barrel protein [Carboxylicivirga marina]|uniref:Outer membrane beta-barrel protein n=1 Tax=Carboxylicivirga marina TaxID=2800988 RepID=A0ABS1HK24_9BACT|nr:outer membrane beta-barrel protein [Carboxylicivirga marina]MBK3517955.1 outer membrane beta-barrel protein [Carboxylicivirga marina]
MKKILTIIAVIAMASLSSFAQTEKGKWVFSGSSDLSFTTTTMTLEYDGEEMGDSDLSSFNLTPTIAYFVADDFALGLGMNVENSKQDDYTTNSLLVGPIARYYVGGSSSVKPYLQAAYFFGSQKEDDDVDEAKAKASSWEIGGGAAIFLNEFASLDMSLGYGNATLTSNDDDKFKVKVKGLAVNVGFSFYF